MNRFLDRLSNDAIANMALASVYLICSGVVLRAIEVLL